MDLAEAEKIAKMALAGLEREFPNKPGVVMNGIEDVRSPRELYPVFYGHFDWHSSVHGHWALVRLVRLFPELSIAEEIWSALERKFTQEGLEVEAMNLAHNPSFERMYGWAWALRLGLELRLLEGGSSELWKLWYRPVEQVIVDHAKNYLPKLDWAVRCGFHPETAFPLGQMLDWARAVKDNDFEALIIERSKTYYGGDKCYPVEYEPSGNDFFSSGLNEADLMRRVYTKSEYEQWLGVFFPGLKEGKVGNLMNPVRVRDLDDGHLVHLVGLNLSRAWAMRGIASCIEGPMHSYLLSAAEKHEQEGLAQVHSGSYEGEHWLGTFAVYLQTQVGL